MQRWAIIITIFYAAVLVALILPAGAYLADLGALDVITGLFDLEAVLDGGWIAWLIVAGFVAAEALLLLVSVDTSRRRLKPRRRIALSVLSVTAAVGALGAAFVWPIVLAVGADEPLDWIWLWALCPFGLWLFWGVVFFAYRERISEPLDRTVGWLLNGSVLQLLVAVPCHIIVRQRHDCCAPVVTGYGIATGLAVMLMAFGPSVVFLYQRRLREYDERPTRPSLIYGYPYAKLLGTLALGWAATVVLLPFEDGIDARFDLPAQRSSIALADLDALATSLGLSRVNEDNGFSWVCGNDSVGQISIHPSESEGLQHWDVQLRADQPELTAVITDLSDEGIGTGFLSAPPSAYERWRVMVVHGTTFSRRCTAK